MFLIQMAANQIFPLCSIVKPKARPSKYWTLRPSAALSKTHKPLQVFVILVFALKRSANLTRPRGFNVADGRDKGSSRMVSTKSSSTNEKKA